jgi:uncharacterized protein YdiU (UPF0061 family)
MNNVNPFEAIVSQMNQAKAAYDQTMASLQTQLGNARQQAAQLFQNPMMQQVNPYHQNPYQQQLFQQPQTMPQQQPMQQSQQATPQVTPQPVEAIPPHVQQMTAIGEVKALVEKLLERVPEIKMIPDKKEEQKVALIQPSNK